MVETISAWRTHTVFVQLFGWLSQMQEGDGRSPKCALHEGEQLSPMRYLLKRKKPVNSSPSWKGFNNRLRWFWFILWRVLCTTATWGKNVAFTTGRWRWGIRIGALRSAVCLQLFVAPNAAWPSCWARCWTGGPPTMGRPQPSASLLLSPVAMWPMPLSNPIPSSLAMWHQPAVNFPPAPTINHQFFPTSN